MQAISTKELRQKLPMVRSELAKGESFLIVHHNIPIGKILPLEDSGLPWHQTEEGQLWMQTQDEDSAKTTDPDEYLTKEEYEYYISL